jgi:glucose/arabinose dehydrogenase
MLSNPYKVSFGFLSFILLICGLATVCSILFNIGEFWIYFNLAHATSTANAEVRPHINDKDLEAIVVVEGLKHPTSMAFLGPNDFVVLEKKTGMVKRILNGTISDKPLLDVEVANEKERGMLGIAISKNDNQSGGNSQKESEFLDNHLPYVFLYYTESSGKDGNDDCPLINYCKEGTEPKGNRLYRYDLEQDKLTNPKLLLDLPANPGSDHLGGAVVIGPDKNVYLTTGDGDSCSYHSCDKGVKDTVLNSQSANVESGNMPDGRGGILRITQDGLPVSREHLKRIFHENGILGKYYAYGIRNSYGIDFDPLSGKLWDTENGPAFGDEINLVEPGFNSGWMKVQGIWPISNYTLLYPQGLVPPYRGYFVNDNDEFISGKGANPKDLVDFQGQGKYSDPEFIWNMTVGVTALKFLNSDKLGEKYNNDMFVADSNNGNLYHFDLNRDRTKLLFDDGITDRMVHSLLKEELDPILFGEGFDSVTDLEVGPDGYLYVVSYKQGKIFKIVPASIK